MSAPSPADAPPSAANTANPQPEPAQPASSSQQQPESTAFGLALQFDQRTGSTQAQAPAGPASGETAAAGGATREVEGSSSSPSTSALPKVAKEARFTEGPPETRTISPAPSAQRRPSSSSSPSPRPSTSRRPSYAEPPSLTETHKDLRALLKSFLLLVPRSIRQLRFLIPSPFRIFARFIVRQVSMFLHGARLPLLRALGIQGPFADGTRSPVQPAALSGATSSTMSSRPCGGSSSRSSSARSGRAERGRSLALQRDPSSLSSGLTTTRCAACQTLPSA